MNWFQLIGVIGYGILMVMYICEAVLIHRTGLKVYGKNRDIKNELFWCKLLVALMWLEGMVDCLKDVS